MIRYLFSQGDQPLKSGLLGLTLLSSLSLSVQVEGQEGRVVKLSPEMRVSGVNQALAPITQQKIEAFLERHQVFSPEALAASAYIVGAEDDRLILGKGDLVYVKGLSAQALIGTHYMIYRAQQHYPDLKASEQSGRPEWLGIEMQYMGSAQLESLDASDGIAVMRITQAKEEIRTQDLVTLNDLGDTPATFYPQAPVRRVQASVLSILGGLNYGGKNSLIALNAGQLQRVSPGNLLKVAQQRTAVLETNHNQDLALPSETIATVMVFRTFQKVSYALVLEASKPITVGDQLISP